MNKINNNAAVAAGIAGAVIGAGVTAATVALSDKKMRTKVLHTLNEAKDHAIDMRDNNKQKATKLQEKAEEAIEDGQKTVYKAINKSKPVAKTP